MKSLFLFAVLVILSISLVAGFDVNHENVEEFLSEHEVVNDLPSGAEVLVQVGDENYIMRKGVFERGFIEDSDATIIIDEKYLDELESDNFCFVMKKIVSEKGFKFKKHVSLWSLIWKYKKMLKYWSCFY